MKYRNASISAILLTIFFTLGLGSASTSHAMVVRGGETFNLDSYATIEDDLYVVGQSVTFAGTTTGDVLALGSYVEQSGPVTEDLLIAGGNIVMKGDVEGDVRVFGGKVYVSDHVKEDAVFIGGTIHIAKDAVIDGDLFVIAEQLFIEGTVHGLVEMKVRTAEIKGTINKDVRASIWESLTLTGDGKVQGNLSYSAPREAFISDTAVVVGNKDFTQTNRAEPDNKVDVFALMFSILLTVVSAVTFVYFFPAQARSMTNVAMREGNSMHIIKGVLLLVGWPLLSFILIITVLGSIPGLILLGTFGTVFLIAMAFTPVLAGVLFARWVKKGKSELTPSWASLGAITITLIAYVPILGGIVRFLLFLLAFYTVSIMIYENVWLQRTGKIDVGKKEKDDTKETPKKEGGLEKV